MKRISRIAILILVAMLALIISGCGGGGAGDSPYVVNQKLHGGFASSFIDTDPSLGDKVTPEVAERICLEASKVSDWIMTFGWLDKNTCQPLGVEQMPPIAKRYGMKVA